MEISSEHRGPLLAEMNEMREQVMELRAQIGQPSLSEFCKYFTPKLLACLDKWISMESTPSPGAQQQQQQRQGNPVLGAESTRSGSPSPRSENSNSEFRKGMPKKRKTMAKWTNQVRLNEGVAGGHDDGYSWRKYGQKIILGAKYPRGYFRCTHRHTQSCLATKQVQRSDDDPQVFDVTYHGTHTCLLRPQPAAAAPARHGQVQAPKPQQANQQQQQQLLQSFRTDLTVKTEGDMFEALGDDIEASVLFSFSGPDAMLDNAFCSPSTPAASFFSSATSESTYFSMSPCRVGSFDGLLRLNSSESDVISAANSVSASPALDLSSFSQLEFAEDFEFIGSLLS